MRGKFCDKEIIGEPVSMNGIMTGLRESTVQRRCCQELRAGRR